MTRKKSPSRTDKKKLPTLAERADPHALYQAAVQYPPADLEFFLQAWKRHHRRVPLVLREDFCGTAHLAATWVAGSPRRRALAVDLDAETLEWGRTHNITPALANRVTLVCNDVRAVKRPLADMTCALNFSYCVFKTRAELGHYFETAFRGLVADGVFFCEIYGGSEAMEAIEETKRVGSFTYEWQQESFDPLTHETVCHIHFRFRDGSRLRRAFTYEWRLWTVPELRELLLEAGFRRVTVYWEEVDEDGEGTGEYRPAGVEENQESWIAYLVAEK